MTRPIAADFGTVELAGDPLGKELEDLRVRLAEAEGVIYSICEIAGQYVTLAEGPGRSMLAGVSGAARHYRFRSRKAAGR